MKRHVGKALLLFILVSSAMLLALPLVPLGCGGGVPLILAAASDLYETGIVQAWADDYADRSGREVEVLVAQDLEVMDMARHGECDLIVVHFPDMENELLRKGFIEGRQEIMRDDYVIVGPPSDPAGVRGAEAPPAALRMIAEAQAPFILRIDGSGTADRANNLWAQAGVEESEPWLERSGAGMEEVLRAASGKGAYTISDRSGFQRLARELDLEILFAGGEALRNPSSAALVGRMTYPDTDTEGAQRMVDYLLSEGARGFFSMGAWEPPPGGGG